MIKKVWSYMLLIILLMGLPFIAYEYYFQRTLNNMVFELLTDKNESAHYKVCLDSIKSLAKMDKANEKQYRNDFEFISSIYKSANSKAEIMPQLQKKLNERTILIVLAIISIAGLAAFFISRKIVSMFGRLNRENEKNKKKVDSLQNLKVWQKTAKELIHEIRGPLTPVKLVTSEIEHKYQNLRPEQFEKFLHSTSEIINEQIENINKMLDSCSKFAKLPEVKLENKDLGRLLTDFNLKFQNFNPAKLDIKLFFDETKIYQCQIDSSLLENLLFNVIKNAVESNSEKIVLYLKIIEEKHSYFIEFQNYGELIPESIAKNIFDFSVSTKLDSVHNMGLGLTISRKIALDHGGDLYLKFNDKKNGVVFELELPKV